MKNIALQEIESGLFAKIFSLARSIHVSFNLQGAQRFIEFSLLFMQSLRIGQTEMTASLINFKKS